MVYFGEPSGETAGNRKPGLASIWRRFQLHYSSSRRYVLHTPLPKDECIARIRRQVSAFATPFGARTDFLGHVSGAHFELRFIGAEARTGTWLPVFAQGHVEDHAGGAQIEVELQTGPLAVIGAVAGLVFCLAVGLVALGVVLANWGDSLRSAMPYPLGLVFLVGAWYCAMWLLRDNSSLDRFTIGMLETSLEAVVVVPPAATPTQETTGRRSADEGG